MSLDFINPLKRTLPADVDVDDNEQSEDGEIKRVRTEQAVKEEEETHDTAEEEENDDDGEEENDDEEDEKEEEEDEKEEEEDEKEDEDKEDNKDVKETTEIVKSKNDSNSELFAKPPKSQILNYVQKQLDEVYYPKNRTIGNLGGFATDAFRCFTQLDHDPSFIDKLKIFFNNLKKEGKGCIFFTFHEMAQYGAWLILLRRHLKNDNFSTNVRIDKDEGIVHEIWNAFEYDDDLSDFLAGDTSLRVLPKPVYQYITSAPIKVSPFMFWMYFCCARWAKSNKKGTKISRCLTKEYCERVEDFFKERKNVKALKTLFTEI